MYHQVFYKKYIGEFINDHSDLINAGATFEISKDYIANDDEIVNVRLYYAGKEIVSVQKTATGTLYITPGGKIYKTKKGIYNVIKKINASLSI